MNLSRVWAVVMRHLYHFRRSWDRLSDCVYWPVLDLLMWGLSTAWLQSMTNVQSNLLLIMLTAIVFWQIVWRAHYEICVNFLEEIHCRNLVNMLSTPLTTAEWVAGLMGLGIAKLFVSILIGFIASWVLYSLNILAMGFLLIPFLASLVLFGWTLGFVASGLIARFGREISTVAWMLGFLFAPISAVYYPVTALPVWMQPVAWTLPTTWIFEGMRQILSGGEFSLWHLAASFALNGVYLSLAVSFFMTMFEYRRSQGLQGLEN